MKKNTFLVVLFVILYAVSGIAQQTITILHLNDTHSTLAPLGPRDESLNGKQGGIARATSVIASERASDTDLLLLHAGDISVGDLFFNYGFQVPELTWMNMMGFDAMAIGNHEFDLTPAVLLGSLQNVFPLPSDAFPLLGANVNASAIPELDAYISDYTTKMIGTVKVGIFGLLTPATNILSQPGPVIIEDDIETIMNIAGTNAFMLRNLEGCDIVILLSHLGVEFDMAIASMVPGIDIIIGGHDHYNYSEPMVVPNPNSGFTWIAQAGSNYTYIGKLKIDVTLDGTVSLNEYSLIHLDESIPEEPTVKAMVDGLVSDIETFYDIPFFTEAFGYADAFHKEEAKDLEELGVHDTPIGNLVTDAFRNLTGTDIAIHAGGSTALPIWEGTFTLADIFRVNGYGFNMVNTLGFQIATFTLSGEALWMGLEFGLSEIESNDEFFIQVSGLEYKYDATKPAGERLVSVLINNQMINPIAIYSVTASELVIFLLDYLEIPYSDPDVLAGVTEFEALSAYIISNNNFLHPKEIGRIVNVGDQQAINRIESEGCILSEAGAFLSDQNISGILSFKMNLHNVNEPTGAAGVVKVKFTDAGISLTGNDVEFLLIEDNTITIRGEGKNTGKGKYGFLITAIDAGVTGDLIKITIWDKQDGDRVIYDNLSYSQLTGGYINIIPSRLVKHS
ncbi:MAG: 5'-nucleotidase C-terminal domain-containing protein, partial [Ignavibacteriaceae bacterium]